MYRVFCLVLLIFTAHSKAEDQLSYLAAGTYIAKLQWIKMFPPEPILESANGMIMFSNSCGKAEIAYKVNSSFEGIVHMQLGEWCENPFNLKSDEQVIVVNSSGELKSYHGIKIDSNGRRFIDAALSSYFSNLKSYLPIPLQIATLESESDAAYYRRKIDAGIVKIDNLVVNLYQVVYLDDIELTVKR